jgi:hypothetical protein
MPIIHASAMVEFSCSICGDYLDSLLVDGGDSDVDYKILITPCPNCAGVITSHKAGPFTEGHQ